MFGEVTQRNLHLFIPGKIAGVAALMSHDKGTSVLEAMKAFYATRTCKLLEREETKYWHYSPAQLYAEMQDDLVLADN